ncbi:hypothetical protein [Pseudomonas sp. S3_E04]
MTDFFTSTWAFIAVLPVGAWGVIGALLAALITARVSLWNTRRTLEVQGRSLDVQRLTNARSASTFIADKRQKWIDDLRNDASKYLSLSLETADAWKQLYWKCGSEYDENPNSNPLDILKTCEALRISFLSENATRDSEHHQLYMRIILRLNNDETAHQELTSTLVQLRTQMAALANAALKGHYSNQELLDSIAATLSLAAQNTKIILKEEWQRLKREVADPDRLIHEILSVPEPKVIVAEATPRGISTGVASSLSLDVPQQIKSNG